jgi:dTDP-4-dehydrorhamnose 3,5-epimerase
VNYIVLKGIVMSENRSSSTEAPPQSLLDLTLAAARRDRQTVSAEGRSIDRLTDGLTIRPLVTHVDERGSVTELFDPRWDWHPDPLVFAYTFTIRPGVAKGWNLHREHEDRYAVLQGELALILFDPRPESATCGQVCRLVFGEQNRSLVNIPKNVWHADHNIGSRDVLVVNFPTTQYDHASPDKYRLPLDSPLIPYSFAGVRGW